MQCQAHRHVEATVELLLQPTRVVCTCVTLLSLHAAPVPRFQFCTHVCPSLCTPCVLSTCALKAWSAGVHSRPSTSASRTRANSAPGMQAHAGRTQRARSRPRCHCWRVPGAAGAAPRAGACHCAWPSLHHSTRALIISKLVITFCALFHLRPTHTPSLMLVYIIHCLQSALCSCLFCDLHTIDRTLTSPRTSHFKLILPAHH